MNEVGKTKNSGQVLLIAAFMMATLILSTQLYIFELTKITSEDEFNSLDDFVFVVKLGSQHVVIGSLANVSNGGATSVLAFNLERWSSLISKQYHFGKIVLNYMVREMTPYSSGFWINWSSNGYGVSSAYVSFTFALSDQGVSINMPYFVNITTTLLVKSTFRTTHENEKQVNVNIKLLNEQKPALAQQIAVYYKVSDSWLPPNASNDYVVFDYGNGTYLASFTAEIPTPSVEVSVKTIDHREISVQANATST